MSSNIVSSDQSPLVEAFGSIQAMPNLPLAACAGHPDADSFTADRSNAAKAFKIAKKICAGCPELAPCREFAMNNKCEGVWGGLTERERQAQRQGKKVPNPELINKRLSELELLRSKRTAFEVAQLLGCTERTVYRKRKKLKLAAAVPVEIRKRPVQAPATQYALVS